MLLNYVHVQPVTEHLFHWTSTDINTKIKLMLVQNYGWPTGPANIWLWLARRPFGWPRAIGKHDPCALSRGCIDLFIRFLANQKKGATY